MKFRKKPVVIEAWQWNGTAPTIDKSWPKWLIEKQPLWTLGMAKGDYYMAPSIQIHTLEGVMRAEPFDWIIKGVKGELYPCKPDIFEATYEPVQD